MPGIIHSVDIRLCGANPDRCYTASGCTSFSIPYDGTCGFSAPGTPSSSFLLDPSGKTGVLNVYKDSSCANPDSDLFNATLVLDGGCHDLPPVGSYTAALRSTCLAPDPFGANFYNQGAVSGKRFQDAGNYDACVSMTDYQYCILEGHSPDAIAEGLYAGVCVPSGCTPADLLSTNSSIHGWLTNQVDDWDLEFPFPTTTVRCGAQTYPFDTNARVTASCLGVLALAVLACTLYSIMFPKAKGRGKGKGAPDFTDVVHASSLTTTWRRIFCFSPSTPPPPPPSPTPTPAFDLAAMDGMRVLSLSLVILGHSFFFPDADLGFSNNAASFALGPIVAKASYQVIPSAEFAVDTFFMLSGALGGLLLTKGLKKALAKVGITGIGTFVRLLTQGGDSGVGVSEGSGSDASSEGFAPLLLSASDTPPTRSLNADDGGVTAPLPPPLSPRPPPLTTLTQAGALATLTIVQAWLYSVLHRYLRLLPSVGVLIAVTMYLVPLAGYGPYWVEGMDASISQCKDHGWTNLLFLNNVLPKGEAVEGRFGNMCVGWTWYLACDMQMHAVALPPLAVVGALFPPWAAFAVLGASMVGAVWASAYAVVHYSLSFLVFGAPDQLSGDGSDHFYDQPVPRSPAFLVGVALGWALMVWEERCAAAGVAAAKRRAEEEEGEGEGGLTGGAAYGELALGVSSATATSSGDSSSTTTTILYLLWKRVITPLLPVYPQSGAVDPLSTFVMALALGLLGLLFYVPTIAYQGALVRFGLADSGPREWSVAEQQLYMSVSRPLWALGCATLLFLCAIGRGGVLGWGILGAPMWKPLAAISFQMYLYHPLVLTVLDFNVITQPRYSPFYLAEHYSATCVLTALLAGLVYLVVEAPLAALERYAFEVAARVAKGLMGGGKRGAWA